MSPSPAAPRASASASSSSCTRGAHVAFVARGAARVAALAQRLAGTHGIAADVASKNGTHPLAIQVTAALGGLDVLINNASTLGPAGWPRWPIPNARPSRRRWPTNLLAPFRLTKALLGALAASARQGRPALVVNITSDAAVNAYPGWGAYGASKAALLHLSRIWDEELREHGVRVIAHDPGDMDTPLHAQALPDADPATLKARPTRRRSYAAPHGRRPCQHRCPHERATIPFAPQRRARPGCWSSTRQGRLHHAPRTRLADFLAPGDLLVANDAATLPASLAGVHCGTGRAIEVRLAGRASLAVDDVRDFTAVVFGEGDSPHPHRAPRRRRHRCARATCCCSVRCAPPSLQLLDHPRLVALRFEGAADAIWAGIARHGKPIQYAHVPEPLALWDVWTRVAALAGRVRAAVGRLRARLGAAARPCRRAASASRRSRTRRGISSTGDDALDARLPLRRALPHARRPPSRAIADARARTAAA